MKHELLAPAGSFEAFEAALSAGALFSEPPTVGPVSAAA